MEWMTTRLFATAVVQPGRSISISERGKTSNVLAAGCIRLWSSNTARRSALLGRETLTPRLSRSLSLTGSQSYLALEPVDTLTVLLQVMSDPATKIKK